MTAEYGKWNLVYRCYAHWCNRGGWPRLMAYLQVDPDLSAVRLDSTVVRAHMSAAGTPKTKGQITPWVAAGAASAPRSTSWRIAAAVPCACA